MMPTYAPLRLPQLQIVLLLALLLNISACSSFMPAELRDPFKKLQADAKKLMADHPDYSHTYMVGARKMHYVEVTNPQAKALVIFIHGSPGDWSGWTEFLLDPDLQARASLIAVDRPGFGDSGSGKAEKSLAEQSRDLAPLLDQAKPGELVMLVGHSFGGPVAVRLAMDHPDKVTDLVILAGSIDPAQEHTKWFQYPADWLLLSWMVPSELLSTNREIMALKGELTGMAALWPRVTQRVTVIQGEADDLVPPENADFAEKMLTAAKSVKIIRIPNMNHFLPWKKYDVVKEQILHHFDDAPGPTSAKQPAPRS